MARIHALEVAQAMQTAVQAGSVATLTATQAGAQVGTVGMMVAGSVDLIVGIFLGLAIHNSQHG